MLDFPRNRSTESFSSNRGSLKEIINNLYESEKNRERKINDDNNTIDPLKCRYIEDIPELKTIWKDAYNKKGFYRSRPTA